MSCYPYIVYKYLNSRVSSSYSSNLADVGIMNAVVEAFIFNMVVESYLNLLPVGILITSSR